MRTLVTAFDPSIPIEKAWTPPAGWYTDERILALETRTVFTNHWMAVARADQVSQPGDFVTADVGTEPVVVVRGQDQTLRAFYNVCRHHAACVMKGEGRAEQLTCPYHGWTYDLDGRLSKAPRMAGVEDFERSTLSLTPIAVTTWGPLVFVCLGEPPPTLSERLSGLSAALDGTHWDELVFVAQETYEVPCNWKVYADNYLDGGYHIPTIHPDLNDDLDMAGYQTELGDGYSIQCAPSAPGVERVGEGALYAFVHPNLTLNRYGPVLDINRILPMGVDRCAVIFDYFFQDTVGSEAEAFIAESLATSRRVQDEDMDVCDRVQRGLGSRSYDRGRYAPRVEMGEYHFHGLLAADYRSGL
jgi:choline monooxygenase